MGELIVVTGPPGAGKSSVSAVLADKFTPSALVAGDERRHLLTDPDSDIASLATRIYGCITDGSFVYRAG